MQVTRHAIAAVALVALGCGNSSVPSPFGGEDAGAGGSSNGSDASTSDAGEEGAAPDPTLGGPCIDSEQCDDGIDCTFDSCDQELLRCRLVPDHTLCADGVHCNGEEVCSPLLGCRPGEPVACSDDNTCTIDACVESDRTCSHEPRDVDGDGDPDWNCAGGGDCNDTNPTVSSQAVEVCGNEVDDNCDGEMDETPCESPKNDTCLDPLEIAGDGTFLFETAAATSQLAATCAGTGSTWRDVVGALLIPAGPPVDVDIVASAPTGSIALASAALCGDSSSELGCAESFSRASGGRVSRLRLRALAPGNYPLYVFSDRGQDITVQADFRDASPKATNETCGLAEPIVPGVSQVVELVDADVDVPSECDSAMGELVYSFTLAETQDVEVFATSLDGNGTPSVSLRAPGCQGLEDEITCQSTSVVALFARALPAGTYFVAVSATAPTDVDVVVEVSPPTPPPPDDSCDGAPAIAPNQTITVPLAGHADSSKLGCLVGARDAAYALTIDEPTDVLLVQSLSDGDSGAISLATLPCATSADALTCGTSSRSPNRAARHNVSPGSYRVVAETFRANPVAITALTRPAAPPVFVAFADTCDQAINIPSEGGFFQGNTANVDADYDASCDLGGQAQGGAPDQMLRLVLTEPRRVVFDMKGSPHNTLLNVRRGPDCPGDELAQACAAGFVADKSYLDLDLEPGEYFVQVDGYQGSSGPWQLEVFVVDP